MRLALLVAALTMAQVLAGCSGDGAAPKGGPSSSDAGEPSASALEPEEALEQAAANATPPGRKLLMSRGVSYSLLGDPSSTYFLLEEPGALLEVWVNLTSLYADPYFARAPEGSPRPYAWLRSEEGDTELRIEYEEQLGYALSAGENLDGPFLGLQEAAPPGNWTVSVAGWGFNVRADVAVYAIRAP